ncbi:MAG TPA: hypothetical protein VE152_06550, partial [Acidimicrobiales bacterium]|nr:hypothetical protein [Acidimicrobiales bacterium]
MTTASEEVHPEGAGAGWTGRSARALVRAAGRSRLAGVPASVLLVAGAALVGVVETVLAVARITPAWGDQAVLELQTRQAVHFQALLGPYSRFGWRHPGPAYFYVLAPFYALDGHGFGAMVVGTLVLNSVAAVATVWVIRRHAGEAAALWAAAAVGAYLLGTGPALMFGVANPYILALPLLLATALAAGAARGSLPCLVWAAVAVSFVVQSDVSAVPVATIVLGVGVVAYLASLVGAARGAPGPGRTARRLGVATGLGLVVLVGMWVPPLYQQVTHHPGNLAALARFFVLGHHPHGQSPTFHHAAAAALDEMTWVPLGALGIPADTLSP